MPDYCFLCLVIDSGVSVGGGTVQPSNQKTPVTMVHGFALCLQHAVPFVHYLWNRLGWTL